jgi:lysophospholipase L1-like esterase
VICPHPWTVSTVRTMRMLVRSILALSVGLTACGHSNETAATGTSRSPDEAGGPAVPDSSSPGANPAYGATVGPDATAPSDTGAAPANDADQDASHDGAAPFDTGVTGADDAAPADASADATAASDAGPSVRLIGRFDLTNPGAPAAEWSASAMEARFSGTSVAADLGGDGNYFAVVVDGTLLSTVVTDGGSGYPIATGLTQGSHDVLVFRRDEALDEPSSFLGFTFGSGTLLPPPAAPARRIEIIGDSISAGYGDECTNASQSFAAATENEYIAYGPLTARSFGADIHVVAWSGKGMYRNLDGTTTETMPILWQRTIPTDANSTWNPAQWIPDVVVINLGTNDYNANSTDPSPSFEATYLAFVATLRAAYPDAFIFGTVGPMLSGSTYDAAKAVIMDVVSMRAAAGDSRMALVEFPTQDCGSDGSSCGCAYHPNGAEHEAMATILEAAIHAAMGW